MMRGMFQVQGGRWLQHYRILPDARSAAIWKWTAHAGFDALFVGVAMLAPIGLVVARRPREAILVALWLPELVALSAIAGYAGARYRSPVEPHLIVLASACLAGAWRPAGKLWIALGVAGSVLVGAIVLPQVPRSLAARAQYGVAAWNGMVPGATTTARGPAGVNLLPREGAVSFRVALSDGGNRAVPAAVWLNGRRVSEPGPGQPTARPDAHRRRPGVQPRGDRTARAQGATGPGLHDHRIALSSDRSTCPRRRRRSSQSVISARIRSAFTFCSTAGCTSSKAARRPSFVNSPGCSL